MRHGNPTAQDLVPPGFAGSGLANYRTLLPLYSDEYDAFSPWEAFLPDGPDSVEQLRTMDLDDLRREVASAGNSIDGWDSPRGKVSDDFVSALGQALNEFVPGNDSWMLMRWRGHKHFLAGAEPVEADGLQYGRQVLTLAESLISLRELGMPEFMWCSTGSFAWGSPRYPDFGVMTMAAADWIEHFSSRNFESFYLTADTVLPDNLGD